jgi:type II secretory pathway component GspD/PulD (secretin)
VARLKIPNVKNLLQVEDVMVETDVQFVEVDSDDSKDMGFNVLDSLGVTATGGLSGASGTGGKIPMNFGVSATASAQIKALLGNSSGKIVAQPHLTTKSGDVGNFQSGGTKYFAVPSTVGPSTLQSVDYGVLLKVKPSLQGRDHILNEVTIEVSIPISDPTGVLTVDKYSTTSTALCKVGESMVLSGMVQHIANKTGSKTPLLGDIPLVDLFFSNKTSDRQRKEFVIIVTPRPEFPTPATGQPYSEQHQNLIQGGDRKD